ncbi:hypothetical protein BJ742DRAFT_738598 [Cladochytrium replicatum]|nr:hypothetical protein BJ742DRAFT_738598 [Cladochytrium replicatum]
MAENFRFEKVCSMKYMEKYSTKFVNIDSEAADDLTNLSSWSDSSWLITIPQLVWFKLADYSSPCELDRTRWIHCRSKPHHELSSFKILRVLAAGGFIISSAIAKAFGADEEESLSEHPNFVFVVPRATPLGQGRQFPYTIWSKIEYFNGGLIRKVNVKHSPLSPSRLGELWMVPSPIWNGSPWYNRTPQWNGNLSPTSEHKSTSWNGYGGKLDSMKTGMLHQARKFRSACEREPAEIISTTIEFVDDHDSEVDKIEVNFMYKRTHLHHQPDLSPTMTKSIVIVTATGFMSIRCGTTLFRKYVRQVSHKKDGLRSQETFQNIFLCWGINRVNGGGTEQHSMKYIAIL